MQLISKNSPEIKYNSKATMAKVYVSIDFTRIYFTAACSRFCQLSEGQHLCFYNEGPTWHFCKTTDINEFQVTPARAKGGFHITSAGLTGMILKSMGFTHIKKLAILKTNNTIDGLPLYEISQQLLPMAFS